MADDKNQKPERKDKDKEVLEDPRDSMSIESVNQTLKSDEFSGK